MEACRTLLTTREAGLIACMSCARLARAVEGARCAQCGAPLRSRRPHALQWVWAWLLAGMLAYVPAHVFPLMVRTNFGDVSRDTILSGLLLLLEHESYLIALVVFLASVVIPITKFAVIATISLSVQRRWPMSSLHRQRAYELTEVIGRWSMIDVFVVTVLAGLVQVDVLASIDPGMGATFFGLSVICTMVAALSFDPRLLWDQEIQAHV